MTELETLATGFELVEGPTVLPDGALAFSDVLAGGVYRLDPEGNVTTLVPKRRGVGGIAVHADGGIVCTGRDVIRVVADHTTLLLSVEGAAWNDVAVDQGGRVWAGSVRFPVFDPAADVVPGEVWCIERDGSSRPVIEGISHCNGIGFSPAGDRVYVSDTRRDVVVSATLDGSDRRELAFGSPDGLAVDVEGFLWVASFFGRSVARLDPAGAVERTIDLAVPATSVCLTPQRELYITTATRGGEKGSVLRTHVEVPGVAMTPATVDRPRR